MDTMTAPVLSHRKIELQSPEDLRYLLDNATHAARAKIDLNFPPSAAPAEGEDDDGLRRRVEELVYEFVQSTFTLAAKNITVNGLEPPSSLTESLSQQPEEYEPYDTRLATKLQSLYASLESHSHAVAALRRDAPGQAAQYWRDSFTNDLDDDEAELERARERIKGSIEQPEGKTLESEAAPARAERLDWQTLLADDGSGLLQRHAEIDRTWGRSLEGLESLKGTLPATAAKLERAKAVAEYLDGSSASTASGNVSSSAGR